MLTMSNKHKGYRGVWDFWTTASSADGLQTWRISGPSLIATSHHINVSEGYDGKVQLILIWITNDDREIRGKEIFYDIIPYKIIWYRTVFCFKCRAVA